MTDIRAGIAGGAATIALIAVIFAAVFTGVEPPVSQSTEVLNPRSVNSSPSSSAGSDTGSLVDAETDNRTNPAAVTGTASADDITPTGNQFILREYNGIIGVFEPESDAPFLTLDVSVGTLRAADSENLRRGIVVNSETELAQIMEDFDS